MMKKVLFALAVLCTSFWSCNTLDLNDVGYGDGDRLKLPPLKKYCMAQLMAVGKLTIRGTSFTSSFMKTEQ